jgi:prepilin peptidase CpaA
MIVLAVAGSGLAGAWVDLRTRRVPNPLTAGIGLLGLLLAAAQWSVVGVAGAVTGLVLGFILMLPGHVIGMLGGGDVKFFAALGTLLGPQATAAAFLYTLLAGGALALVVAASRGRMHTSLARTAALVRTTGRNAGEIESARAANDNRFPYAPAIAAGTLAAALGV